MMTMRNRWLFLLVIVLILSSCQNRNKTNDDALRDGKVEKTDEANEEEGQIIHANMSYFDFDKVDNLVSFFDSISRKHPLPIWMPEEDDTNERVKRCIARIEAYRKGESRFYPDSLVNSCLKSIGLNTVIVNNHEPEFTDFVYGEWFMMCAAYYSPDITCLVEMQTPDHRAGIFNFGKEYNDNPWWAYLFLKRKKGYEVTCLGDFVAARRIFRLEDEQNRTYYLCSDNNSMLEFRQWLYWAKDADEIVKVAECAEAPSDDGDTEYYFDRNRKIWKLAKWDKATGKLVATGEKPAMSLILDGTKSRFIK